MPVWDAFLTEQDRLVFDRSGCGSPLGFGVKPAVLVVDANYDFVGHEPAPILESIVQWRNSCGQAGWRGIAAIAELLDGARRSSVPVFYTTMFPPRTDGLGSGLWRSSRLAETAGVPGVEGTDIVKEIAPEPGDVVLRKNRPSAFFGTPLLSLLLEIGVDTLIVAGTTTSGCVRATVVDAFSYNFRVTVMEEATFDRGEASHAVSLFDMQAKYADVTTVARTLEYFRDLPLAERLTTR
jgi:maleamate amidohydrolase